MNYFDRLKIVAGEALAQANKSRAVARLMDGSIGLNHYQWVMRQIFHHARENPQLQALATVYFRGSHRKMVPLFYKHASQEIGHDQLALDDLAATGLDTGHIPFENPLPATSALLGFGFYQIQNLNPIGYLGYLFFLEFMPTQSGSTYIELFKRAGVPENAFSFIGDHAKVDIAHTKLMERYVNALVTKETDFDAVAYSLRTTSYLYVQMILAAFEQADSPFDYGTNHGELQGPHLKALAA